MRNSAQFRFFEVLLLLQLLSWNSLFANSSEDGNRPALVVPRLQSAPSLANFLEMKPSGEVERSMARVEGFIQQQPSDGKPSTQRTEVYCGYDEQNIYFVFVAFDTEPDKVRARMRRRENIFGDDIVEVMLDTFHDKRRAYAFVTNPLGIQWDALWTEGAEFDGSFDTLWHSEGKLTEQGYVVWIAIPFKSLRFPESENQEWGVVFLREILRGTFEQTFWPRVSSRIEGRLNQAATMQIQDFISPGRNVQLIPYASSRSFRIVNDGNQAEPSFLTENLDADVGIDAKAVFRDSLALDLTANPDFSQVESDEPQVTINQRFEVFFPEKRPFFLENSNYFQTPINLLFTRRIADPQYGARLTGKTGPYALGALLINDESPGKLAPEDSPIRGKSALFAIFRLSRDILDQSSLSITYTDREIENQFNRVFSIDSRIKFNANWTATLQGAYSSTKDQNTENFSGTAFDVLLERVGRSFDSHTHYRSYGPDFVTRAGFVPRVDVRDVHHFMEYNFRPEGKHLIAWGPDFFIQRIWDYTGTRLDDVIEASMGWEFTGSTQLQAGYSASRIRLRPEDFPVLQEDRDFPTHYWQIAFQTGFLEEMALEAQFSRGTAVNFVPPDGQEPYLADNINAQVDLTLRPLNRLEIDNSYIFFQLNDRTTSARILQNQIFRSKFSWQFNRKLSLRFILQYDSNVANPELAALPETRNFNLDFLVTYLVNPWTALYVGVNSNYRDLDLIPVDGIHPVRTAPGSYLNDSRQFFVKYSHLIRF